MFYTDGIETERMITRFVTQQDADTWVPYFEDPVNSAFIPNPSLLTSEERAQEMINFTLKRYRENRLGLQALIHKETGELIGLCGVMIQEISGKTETEVGYHLLRKHWGKGYATEAAQRFRDYGFEYMRANSIVSIIHPLNLPSKNVALRNGMTLKEKGASWRGYEVDVYRIDRAEWERLKDILSTDLE